MKSVLAALLGVAAVPAAALAQDHSGHDDHQAGSTQTQPAAAPQTPAPKASPVEAGQTPAKPAMDHSAMDHGTMDHGAMGHGKIERPTAGPIAYAEGSGTARLPANDGAMHGLHIMAGDWMVMAHGSAALQYTNHGGPRGDDQVYVTTMAMLAGERETTWGRIQGKAMMSLEPAMDAKGYPNLFATGETADGLPLVDRQHPHDLFMELAARIDVNAGPGSLFLYGGPVGEPALGPSAFMHRGSAKYNPEPPITHHWFDSTHITYGVVTAGYATRVLQVEASAFRGREPDEQRWNIETPKLDSWSVRATLTPSPRWAIQASYGQLKQPEALHPGEDEHRFTASAHYADGGVHAMLAFSAKDRVPGQTLTAWLAEANWDIDRRNTLFARAENVANDELFADENDPLHDQTFRVSKVQLGYARRIALGPVELALGGSVNAYAKPAALDAAYGSNPMGYTLFARITLGH
ncbi:hypothetical protein [Novosphingobium sp.]|uniref:hypothetical protein n=1 Tax=Novosphingobium sp. TaxID=1874826 RepID=UPI0025FD094C|nr:hypothetical protein [Novosphingobium sp.]